MQKSEYRTRKNDMLKPHEAQTCQREQNAQNWNQYTAPKPYIVRYQHTISGAKLALRPPQRCLWRTVKMKLALNPGSLISDLSMNLQMTWHPCRSVRADDRPLVRADRDDCSNVFWKFRALLKKVIKVDNFSGECQFEISGWFLEYLFFPLQISHTNFNTSNSYTTEFSHSNNMHAASFQHISKSYQLSPILTRGHIV